MFIFMLLAPLALYGDVHITNKTTTTTRWHPLRIVVSDIDLYDPSKFCSEVGQIRSNFLGKNLTCQEGDVLVESTRRLITTLLLPSAVHFLSKALYVGDEASEEDFLVHASMCGSGASVPEEFTRSPGVKNADFVLLVTAGPFEKVNTFAFAGTCAYFNRGRPAVAQINISPAGLNHTPLAIIPRVRVVLHELLHSLGFSHKYIEERFPKEYVVQRTVRGKLVRMITSPEVQRTARAFFACDALEGLELEDEGGVGTTGGHWEKRILMNEIMVGATVTAETTLSVSPMTLAYFKDTGHYEVDMTLASPPAEFQYGYQAGCAFLQQPCNSTANRSYFCFEETERNQCSKDRSSIAVCALVSYPPDALPPREYQYFSTPSLGGLLSISDYCPFLETTPSMVCTNPFTHFLQSPQTLPLYSSNVLGNYYSETSRCIETAALDPERTWQGLTMRTASHAESKEYIQLISEMHGGSLRCLGVRCDRPNSSSRTFRLSLVLGHAQEVVACPETGEEGWVLVQDGEYRGKVRCPAAAEVCPSLEADQRAHHVLDLTRHTHRAGIRSICPFQGYLERSLEQRAEACLGSVVQDRVRDVCAEFESACRKRCRAPSALREDTGCCLASCHREVVLCTYRETRTAFETHARCSIHQWLMQRQWSKRLHCIHRVCMDVETNTCGLLEEVCDIEETDFPKAYQPMVLETFMVDSLLWFVGFAVIMVLAMVLVSVLVLRTNARYAELPQNHAHDL